MKKKLVTMLAISGLLIPTMASVALAAHEGAVYKGTLTELNGSGGSGDATITVSDDGLTMTVEVNASGLNLDGPHAVHIHGIVDGEDVTGGTCPTMADDADGDGVLTVAEGAPKYGGVQVSLTTTGDTTADSALAIERFPAGTSVSYSRATIDIPEVLRPNLAKLHVVVHGVDENGNGTLDLDQEERSSLTDELPREGTAPALCGTLAVQAMGAVQTGAGGTVQTTNSATLPLVFAGIAGVVLTAGIVARRRTVNA